MNSGSLKVISIYVLICLIWGSTWIAIRFGLESLTPLISSGIRFTLAAAVIALIMKFRRISIQKDRTSLILYIILGVFSFAVSFALVYWAEQYIPSGLASVLFGVYPFFVVILSYLFIPKEKISIYNIAGLIIGFSGIVVIFSDQFSVDITIHFWGMAAVVLSGIIQAFIAVAVKKYGYHLNPLSMNFIPMLLSGVILLTAGLLVEDISSLRFDSNAVLSVTYLALFGSIVTFTSFYWLLKRISIVMLSLIAFITPVIALLLGWLLYNEVLLFNHVAGSAMVLAGLLIANLSSVFLQRNKKKEQAVKIDG